MSRTSLDFDRIPVDDELLGLTFRLVIALHHIPLPVNTFIRLSNTIPHWRNRAQEKPAARRSRY